MGRRIEKYSHEKVIGFQGSYLQKHLTMPRTRQYIENETSKPKGIQQETLLSKISKVWKYIYQQKMIIRAANLTIKIKYNIL
jgi:hypothetical protein